MPPTGKRHPDRNPDQLQQATGHKANNHHYNPQMRASITHVDEVHGRQGETSRVISSVHLHAMDKASNTTEKQRHRVTQS